MIVGYCTVAGGVVSCLAGTGSSCTLGGARRCLQGCAHNRPAPCPTQWQWVGETSALPQSLTKGEGHFSLFW